MAKNSPALVVLVRTNRTHRHLVEQVINTSRNLVVRVSFRSTNELTSFFCECSSTASATEVLKKMKAAGLWATLSQVSDVVVR